MKLKIGDKVWAFSEKQHCIQEYEITSIDNNGWYDANATDIPNDDCDDGYLFEEKDVGDFIFLTEQECRESLEKEWY